MTRSASSDSDSDCGEHFAGCEFWSCSPLADFAKYTWRSPSNRWYKQTATRNVESNAMVYVTPTVLGAMVQLRTGMSDPLGAVGPPGCWIAVEK